MAGLLGRASGGDDVEWTDYVIRQHSLVGLYLSLSKGEEYRELGEGSSGLPGGGVLEGLDRDKRVFLACFSFVFPLWMACILSISSYFWAGCWTACLLTVLLWLLRKLLTSPTASDSFELPILGKTIGVFPQAMYGLLGGMLLWVLLTALGGARPFSSLLGGAVLSVFLAVFLEMLVRAVCKYTQSWPSVLAGIAPSAGASSGGGGDGDGGLRGSEQGGIYQPPSLPSGMSSQRQQQHQQYHQHQQEYEPELQQQQQQAQQEVDQDLLSAI